jgi:hypothetical protein
VAFFRTNPQLEGNMLLKVAEDFRKYTLQALPTVLEKLAYISSLQNSEGRYIHWGLSKIFGDHKVQKAIKGVHSDLALELIRVPIRNLCQEYSTAVERTQQPELLSAESFTLKAPASGDELLSAHLRLVQNSLVTVAAHQTASQPAA